MMKDLVKRLEIGLEELILLFLIILELLDWATRIPPELEFAEKILAVIGMSYLFYKASMSSIVTGTRERNYDIMIVVAYIALSLKTIIGFFMTAWMEEESSLHGFYELILVNGYAIEAAGLWIGGIIIVIVAYFLMTEKVTKRSMLWMIHERSIAKDVKHKIVHFISIYLILIAIFVVLFNYAMEWLALTVDAPILVIVLFLYLFLIVKRGKGMKTESFLRKVSDASEGFYEKFIGLLHSRKTFFTAIGGLLVLHLLADIGHFIIPYTTGLMYPWYFEHLGGGHTPLGPLMVQDFTAAGNMLMQGGVLLVYITNLLAILLLFFGPAYIWTEHYRKKKEAIWRYAGIFFGTTAVFVLLPVMNISRMKSSTMAGVDITTQQIPYLQNAWWVLLVGSLVGIIFFALSRRYGEGTAKVMKLSVLIYFGIYVFQFFISIAGYYVNVVALLAQNHRYFMAADMFLFFSITMLFYVTGYLSFVYKTFWDRIPAKNLYKQKSKA